MSQKSDIHEAVGDLLRREIEESRPEFSEELHVRLRSAIRKNQADMPILVGRKTLSTRFFSLAAIAAAACVLAAAWVGLHSPRVGQNDNSNVAIVANRPKTGLHNAAELANRLIVKTDALAAAVMEVHRFDNLKQDAQFFLKTPATKLPFDVVNSLLSMRKRNRETVPAVRPAGKSAIGDG